MRRSPFLALFLLVLVFVPAGAFLGYRFAGPFAGFIVGDQRQDVQFTATDAERAGEALSFAAACAFMMAGAVVAAAVARPGASFSGLAGWVLLFVLVAALAFACAAAYSRYQFSTFVLEAAAGEKLRGSVRGVSRVAQVTTGDVPTVRVPVIAGLCTLVAGALARAVAERVAARRGARVR